MDLKFTELTEPSEIIANVFTRWENDPSIAPYARLNKSQEELDAVRPVTEASLGETLKNHKTYLIYLDDRLIGEMAYQVDPSHLFLKETGTAWLSIVIGEGCARGKGVGPAAMKHLEERIRESACRRIELGVFEFNAPAIALYKKMGYKEITRIDSVAFWQGRLWQDIRMEKRF